MATKEKELEDRLLEVGSRLAYPPSAVDELLLPLLDVSSCRTMVACVPSLGVTCTAGSGKRFFEQSLKPKIKRAESSSSSITKETNTDTPTKSNKLKADVKSDDDISKADKFSSTTGSETEDNSLKSSRNSMVSSPTSAVSKDNGVVGSKVRKDASKSKLSEDSPLTGQKLKGTITPKAGDEFNKEH
ncbi:hypothetical protein BHE74_00048460 [Ensete ventricosum]|nr:hypothetical protein BHE74_00048460 [Ensete ventricosum]